MLPLFQAVAMDIADLYMVLGFHNKCHRCHLVLGNLNKYHYVLFVTGYCKESCLCSLSSVIFYQMIMLTPIKNIIKIK